ncbi:lipase member H-like [Diabrotica undecimpunctata]|uniref:lipase member H-like n=1 Tax=Diabrotica undecimpunctata TaxID=50387 RepID=UPI003B6397E8
MLIQGVLNVTLCALYAQPGPPKIQLQNDTFQLYSINRRLCPEIDSFRDTIFELYTRLNPEVPQILRINDVAALQNSNINYNRPTVFFFHGFLESSQSDNAVQIRNAYLHIGDYNVILVNNERLLAGLDFLTAALNCEPIGKFSAKFVDFLVVQGLQLSSLHIIGMSLGAQIAGLMGKNIKSGKAARVTGLDPAGPVFVLLPKSQRIGAGDGEFVDILHTNAYFNGDSNSIGDLDIWYNGGIKQPGCSVFDILKRKGLSLPEFVFCNHFQAYRTYVQSLYEPERFLITKCKNYPAYLNGECLNGNTTYIGEYIDQTQRGNFYIKTGPTALNV